MSLSSIARAATVAVLLGTAALADDAPSGSVMGAGHTMTIRPMFTPEERMMLFADMGNATARMADGQKKDYRQQQRSRIMAMPDADRARFKADLEARWSSLTADQKAAMTARMQSFCGGTQGTAQ